MQLLPIVQFSSTRSYVNSEFSFLLYPLQSSSVRASIKNDQFSDHSICAILCRKMRNGRWLKEVHNNSFIYRILSERKKKGHYRHLHHRLGRLCGAGSKRWWNFYDFFRRGRRSFCASFLPRLDIRCHSSVVFFYSPIIYIAVTTLYRAKVALLISFLDKMKFRVHVKGTTIASSRLFDFPA